MPDKQIVALTKNVCPFCAKKIDGDLLISTKLRDIGHLHGQPVAWQPCKECQAGLDQGAVMIVVVDESKGSGHKLDEVWRTGNIFGVREEYIRKVLDGKDEERLKEILKTRLVLMDYKVAIDLGFEVKYDPTQLNQLQ